MASQVTTHVLDTVRGRPAAGIPVRLEAANGRVIAAGNTDDDGRAASLGPEQLEPGSYVLVFGVARYFAAEGTAALYPEIRIVFDVAPDQRHYHLPVLLSPNSYTTYRGS